MCTLVTALGPHMRTGEETRYGITQLQHRRDGFEDVSLKLSRAAAPRGAAAKARVACRGRQAKPIASRINRVDSVISSLFCAPVLTAPS
jgi:hypothetical protein